MKKPTKKEIKAFMEKHNLTAQQVANSCFVSKYTVLKWMQGQRKMSVLAWWKVNFDYENKRIDK